jgi:hypothetical protein
LSSAGQQPQYNSLREMRGATDYDREGRQSPQQKAYRRVLRDIACDEFIQEPQPDWVQVNTTTSGPVDRLSC